MTNARSQYCCGFCGSTWITRTPYLMQFSQLCNFHEIAQRLCTVRTRHNRHTKISLLNKHKIIIGKKNENNKFFIVKQWTNCKQSKRRVHLIQLHFIILFSMHHNYKTHFMCTVFACLNTVVDCDRPTLNKFNCINLQ